MPPFLYRCPDTGETSRLGRMMSPMTMISLKIGRPKLGIEIRQKIVQRAKKGETPYAIAKALGIIDNRAYG